MFKVNLSQKVAKRPEFSILVLCLLFTVSRHRAVFFYLSQMQMQLFQKFGLKNINFIFKDILFIHRPTLAYAGL